MDSMFDKYGEKYIANNLYKFLPVKSEYRDIMVIGAFNDYSFTVPHLKENILDADIFYMQGTEHKVKKSFQDITFVDLPLGKSCIAKYSLNPQETLLFNTYNKEVKVQLKVLLIDGTIEYSPIFRIKVLDSLDKDLNIKEEGEF